MQQISQNLYVYSPADQSWDGSLDGCVKIYLSGTIDLGTPVGWQEKFINGLTKMTDPVSGDPRFKDKSWVVMNPKVAIGNPEPTLDNQEFCSKFRWELQFMGLADVVFCNFLKKSKSPSAMTGLLMNAGVPGKTIVRCPLEYVSYPVVKLICEHSGIPVLGDMSTVKDVLEYIAENTPKFKENTDLGLNP